MKEYVAILKNKYLEVVVSIFLISLLPVLFSNSQIITGTLVNSILTYNALKHKPSQIIYLLILPSLVALIRQSFLGPLSPILIYFLIPIWISNYIYVSFIHKKKLDIYFAPILKTLFLIVISLIFISVLKMSESILIPMGLIQLITSVLGLVLGTIVNQFTNERYKKTR